MSRPLLLLAMFGLASAFVPLAPVRPASAAAACSRSSDVSMIVRASAALNHAARAAPCPSDSPPCGLRLHFIDGPELTHAGPRHCPSQRHGVKLKKLNRPADQRKALLRGLTTELIRYGRIRSTLAHVKEVRKTVSRSAAALKRGTLVPKAAAVGIPRSTSAFCSSPLAG